MSDISGDHGERGATGDTGQQGQQGERGFVGLTGVDGGVGLIGERGPTGDHGQDGAAGDIGRRGVHGDTGQRGPQGFAGVAAAVPSRRGNALLAVAAILFLAVIILALAVTFRSQTDSRRDSATNEDLREQLDIIQADRDAEKSIEDCRELFERDILFASIERDIAEGTGLFGTVVLIPIDATPEERTAISRQAVADLNVFDASLLEAEQAYIEYIAIDPPPRVCPHPNN